MIDTEILEDYSSEARELLDEMDHSLIRLEKEGGVPELLNNIFRAVHCIKGSAQYIGLESSSTLTHGVENLLDRLREGLLPLDPPVMEFLFRAKDLISTLIEEVAQNREEKSDISGMMEQLERILQRGSGAKFEPVKAEEAAAVGQEEGQPLSVPSPEPVISEVSEPKEQVLQASEEEQAFEEELETTEELRQYKASLEESDAFDEDVLGAEEDGLYEPMSYVVREYDEEPLEEAETPAFFTAQDAAEIGSQATAEESEPVGGIPAAATGEHAAQPAEPASQAGPQGMLEGSVPQLLTLSLYLDDFQDGFLHPSEIIPSFLETLDLLSDSLASAGVFEATQILEDLKNRVTSLNAERGDFSPQEIEHLRTYLYDLRPHYPDDIFPLGERQFLETPPTEAAALQQEEAPLDPGEATVQGIPLADQAPVGTAELVMETPRDQPAGVTVQGLETTEAFPPPVTDVHRAPTDRTVMADVDDELLSQFENEFESMFADRKEAIHRSPSATIAAQPLTDLAEGLDLSAEESDREIIEIFLDYGLEIMEKLGPLITKMIETELSGDDLNSCADFINSIRSSATYMDYQKLASFLDDWYENTRSAGERVESLAPIDLVFMSENCSRFQNFLKDLRRVLYPEAPPAAILELSVPQPVAAPQPQAETMQPASPAQKPHHVAPAVVPEEVPTVPVLHEVPNPTIEPPAPLRESEVHALGADGSHNSAPVDTTSTAEVPADILQAADRPSSSDLPMARELGDSAVVRTMRVDSAKVDTLLNQVGELVVNRSYVEQLSVELRHFQRSLLSGTHVTKKEVLSIKDLALKVGEASIALGRVATDIQEGVMKLRMLPVGQLFNRMPRLIRDLSRRVGKVVNLEVHGADTEVDKRVIEQIYNPLVHLIRNAVDHGIEGKEARQNLGKSEEGHIVLRAYSQGNQVNIDVEDDGAGIRRDTVVAKAVEHHLIDAQDAPALSTQDVYNFLFFPGFSTSQAVTRTSGRGVGMDVVKKDVEKINGHVDIESWEGEGTRISIKIPLTLAIIQTLLIRSAKHVFAIPLTSVREIIQISPHEITTIEGFEVIKFRQETIPVLRINEVFHLAQPDADKQPRFLVLATAGPRTVGFLVEGLIGEQDVVIKPLADHVFKNRGLAGSTILGDGTIALVLDVAELIEDIIAQQRQLGGQIARCVTPDPQSPVSHSLEM
jgi:two-component system, chemotaxis family, sensor kinase CheA